MLTARADPQRALTPYLLVLAVSVLLLQRFWLFAKVPWIPPIAGGVLLWFILVFCPSPPSGVELCRPPS